MNIPAAHRHNNFNFLRLLFALLVILSHSTELVDGNKTRELLTRLFHTITFGDLAVDGFFLLSGYLIVQSWNRNPEIWDFLKKRVLRIYPAFIIATLISVLIVGALGAANPARYFADLSLASTFKSMVLLLQPGVPATFQGQPYPIVNGSMWTISYEFKCYLAVLILGAIGIFRRKHAWLLLTAAIFIVVSSQKFGFSLPVPASMVEWMNLRLSIFRFASFFFAGACFYLYKDRIRFSGLAASVATLMLLATLYWGQAAELGIALFGGYALFYLAFRPIALIARFDMLPDVSYGVYLYGWPVQKLLLWYFPAMSPWTLFPLSCLLCLILGLMSWHAIEKPFMKLKLATTKDPDNDVIKPAHRPVANTGMELPAHIHPQQKTY